MKLAIAYAVCLLGIAGGITSLTLLSRLPVAELQMQSPSDDAKDLAVYAGLSAAVMFVGYILLLGAREG